MNNNRISLENILQNYHIGLLKSIEIISSNYNLIYKIKSNTGKYVLRIHDFEKDLKNTTPDLSVFNKYFFSLKAVQSEMAYLEDLCDYFNSYYTESKDLFQHPCKNIFGSYVTYIQKGVYASLLTWADGENAVNCKLESEDAEQLGILLARIHNFKTDKIQYKLEYESNLQSFLYKIMKGYHNSIYSKRIITIVTKAVDETLVRLSELRKFKSHNAIIHGDFYTYNILKNNTMFIPIDFGYCSLGSIYQDLASICNQFDYDDNFKKAFVKSYEKEKDALVEHRYLKAYQVYLTLLYLAANYNIKDDYDSWISNLY